MKNKLNRPFFLVFLYLVLPFISSVCFWSCSTTKELSPDQKKAEIYYGYGTNDLVNKDYTSALKNLLVAYELNPNDTKILNNLGMAYYFKKQYELAIKYLILSTKKDEKNADAFNNLASVYLTLGRFEEAEKEYLKITKNILYEHQYRVWYNLGLIKEAQGFPREAYEFFQESVKINEFYCPAHFKIGEVSFAKQDYQNAMEHFVAATKGVCYEEPAPHYYQGLTFLKLKKDQEAKKKFLDVVQRFPKSEYQSLSKLKLQMLQNVILEEEASIFTKEDKRDKNLGSSFLTPNF